MKAKWLYIEVDVIQANKKGYNICGDYYLCKRTYENTIMILCDGIGSGIKANVAAIMCANRLIWLLESGISLIRASEIVISMMHKARKEEDVPFAAFSIAWILNTGQYTVISYESPAPLLINRSGSQLLPQRHFTLAHELVSESIGILRENESLVLVTDGVTQAGMGRMTGLGWGIEGFNSFINYKLNKGKELKETVEDSIEKVAELSGNTHADDATIAILNCREANVLNLMTGPAASPSNDSRFVQDFMREDGYKVICGSTTADIVSKVLKESVEILSLSSSFFQPPKYRIKGIDLVTEGAVTLNQVYNILDENPDDYDEDSCVSDLSRLMNNADIIRFYIGGARNPGHGDISFKQMGVLPRHKIVELLIKKLEDMGKIVLQYRL